MVRLIKMADPPPYGQLFVIFFCVHSTLDYDMCSETDFTHKKNIIFNQILEFPIPPLLLLPCHGIAL